MLAVGPNLASVNRVNALRQCLRRLITKNNPTRAASESINYELPLAGAEQEYRAGLQLQRTKFAEYLQAVERAVLQLCADDRHVRLALLHQCECLLGSDCRRENLNARALGPEDTLD